MISGETPAEALVHHYPMQVEQQIAFYQLATRLSGHSMLNICLTINNGPAEPLDNRKPS